MAAIRRRLIRYRRLTVIDHSVTVDRFGDDEAFEDNVRTKWSGTTNATLFCAGGSRPSAASAWCRRAPVFATGEHGIPWPGGLGEEVNGQWMAWPDTLVGTDSHTTMINGLGVLGWGVGGIEAEAAMLGQPVSMLIPDVVGFKLSGKLREGITATDRY